MAIQRVWLVGLGVAAAGGIMLLLTEPALESAPLPGGLALAAHASLPDAEAFAAQASQNLQQLARSQQVLAQMEAALAASDAVMLEPTEAPVVTVWTRGDERVIQPSIRLNALIQESVAVQVPPAFELDLAPGDKVLMPLPDGSELPVTVASNTRKSNGDLSWKGFVDGYAEDYPVVLTAGEGSTFATLTSPEGSFTLEAVNGMGWVYKNIEVDGEDFLEVDHDRHNHESQAELE